MVNHSETNAHNWFHTSDRRIVRTKEVKESACCGQKNKIMSTLSFISDCSSLIIFVILCHLQHPFNSIGVFESRVAGHDVQDGFD